MPKNMLSAAHGARYLNTFRADGCPSSDRIGIPFDKWLSDGSSEPITRSGGTRRQSGSSFLRVEPKNEREFY